MKARSGSRERRVETIRSPALFLGELQVVENERSRATRWLSGTRLKSLLIPLLYGTLRRAPMALAMAQVRGVVGVMRLLYWHRGSALRLACERLCRIASVQGRDRRSRQVYLQYLANFTGVAENFFRLYRGETGRVLGRIELPHDGVQMARGLLETHGGLMLAVPHNIASALSALALNRAFPLLVVAKNSSTAARTRVALEMFERMQAQVLMVRGGNPLELSRALFRALGSGRVVVATLDNVDASPEACRCTVFGQPVGFARWAAKVAVRRRIPVVPAYFSSRGASIRVLFGEPIFAGDVDALVHAYVQFFERHLLDDPASWAYLGDKHWQRILQAADKKGVGDK
jgi:lauroyl/myristoyl acyltransferase